MASRARWMVSALSLALVVAIAGPRAQQPDPSLATLLERAGQYVEEFEKQFSAVVCEERQTQSLIRADGTVGKQRELKSEFLLVKLGGQSLVAFRDVVEVDGKPVRNREDRLRKLFLEAHGTAVEQARAIVKESGRYNIGVSRTLNSPLLPLHILSPRVASGFRFSWSNGAVAFEEFRSPSVIRHKAGSQTHDLFARGSFLIAPDSARVRAANLTAGSPSTEFQTAFDVRYDEDPALKLIVPVEMKERYWRPAKPREDHLEIVSRYSKFRRFQVTTEEQIKVPK